MRRIAPVLVLATFGLTQTPKEYTTVITQAARTQAGVFKVHEAAGQLYYEIPRDELGRPCLWLTHVSRASSMFGYGGQTVARHIVDWELEQDKVLFRIVSHGSVTDLAAAAISNPSIVMVFPVQAHGPGDAVVIDVTDLFTSDVPELGIRMAFEAQGFDPSRSFIDPSRSFIERVAASPAGIDVQAVYSYTGVTARAAKDAARQSGAPFVLHHSMIKLPDQPMRPRLADSRVGMMTQQFDSGQPTSRASVQRFVLRWRLEKKDPKAPVSDAVKPIEIYVDPATPAKWVPYVKQGIEDWRPILEQAGFRNAMVAREVPVPNANWSAEDARYTVVTWHTLAAPTAFTSVVPDPRSGEILLAPIHFFQGIIDRMAENYFVQAGPLDSRARKWPLPDDLIGAFIRYVVAHEVGHALGLQHNLVASAMYPPAKLRDKNWLHQMGYSPSIEDYSRFNYVAQPEDKVAPEDLVPRIGPYDRWAIHWAYAQIPGTRTSDEEKRTLDAWAREQEKTSWFRWTTENAEGADPNERAEAVGDADPILSTTLGLKNLHRVMDMLIPATADRNWRDLEYLYKRVLGQWTNEMLTVAGWVGGMPGQEKVRVSGGVRFSIVARDRQKAAVAFLNENAFAVPRFLIREDVLRRIEPAGESDHILDAQSWVLRTLLNADRLNRMLEQETIGGTSAYSLSEFLADVRRGVWSEIYSGASIDSWRRNLQGAYLEIVTARMFSAGTAAARSLLRVDIEALEVDIDRTLSRAMADQVTRAHLREAKHRIDDILDLKCPVTPPKDPAEPSYFPLR